jgi:hypothetical protein
MFWLRIIIYFWITTLHSFFTELIPEGAVSLEPSVASDDVLHLGQEPAVNLSSKYCRSGSATSVDKSNIFLDRFTKLDLIHYSKIISTLKIKNSYELVGDKSWF